MGGVGCSLIQDLVIDRFILRSLHSLMCLFQILIIESWLVVRSGTQVVIVFFGRIEILSIYAIGLIIYIIEQCQVLRIVGDLPTPLPKRWLVHRVKVICIDFRIWPDGLLGVLAQQRLSAHYLLRRHQSLCSPQIILLTIFALSEEEFAAKLCPLFSIWLQRVLDMAANSMVKNIEARKLPSNVLVAHLPRLIRFERLDLLD